MFAVYFLGALLMSKPNDEMSDLEMTEWLLKTHADEIKEAEEFFLRMWNARPPNIKYDDLWRAWELNLEKSPNKELLDEEALLAGKLIHRMGFLTLRQKLRAELA